MQALLGNPAQYFPPYQYLKYPPGRYNVNPDVDPNNGTDGGDTTGGRLGMPVERFILQHHLLMYQPMKVVYPRHGPPVTSHADAKLGRWRLAGNTGAWAIHALPFPDGEVLFYQRPSTFNGSVVNPSLKVRQCMQHGRLHGCPCLQICRHLPALHARDCVQSLDSGI